ncbi:hypothetical protein [Rhizobium sp.]|uniref:hypothetical protein n=1 Tax=Rhizobium sp. TaxID=391 RepID=UPI0028A2805A
MAFRPGRNASQVIAVLASLTERNRIAAQDRDADEPDANTSSKSKKDTVEKAASGKDGGGGSKRDKPSGLRSFIQSHGGRAKTIVQR